MPKFKGWTWKHANFHLGVKCKNKYQNWGEKKNKILYVPKYKKYKEKMKISISLSSGLN